ALRVTRVAVSIQSEPSGATVSVDGRLLGTTPITAVYEGTDTTSTHSASASLNGFDTASQTFVPRSVAVSGLALKLERSVVRNEFHGDTGHDPVQQPQRTDRIDRASTPLNGWLRVETTYTATVTVRGPVERRYQLVNSNRLELPSGTYEVFAT